MALIVEGSKIPPRWLECKPFARLVSPSQHDPNSECLRIALINNMPDAALEDTEVQFFDLLDSASGELPVVIKLFSLPHIPRSDRGIRHLNSCYFELNDFWNSRFDALIMTGTEPKCADLRREPYWAELTEVLDWAEANTNSTILSCLAAHAGVLHSHGIERHLQPDKRFGVFEFTKLEPHHLTAFEGRQVRFPHSRWNEVRMDALTQCGYQLLTGSSEAGADLFVKQKKRSLFVHFQGHPEYSAETLFKEYRRDIRRFLNGERETYPSLPNGYFDKVSAQLLMSFQQSVESEPRVESMERFPEAAVVGGLRKTWGSSATAIYANWFSYLLSGRQNATRSRVRDVATGNIHREPVEASLLRPALG
ncbi:MAG TPA: homoserine O-succinyltransferase [Terriglobales bacterium]|nr:homoserine O-succinyltransferase [Terriglobales bacterium]